MSPHTLAEPSAPAFLGIRQQHRQLDFVVTLRAPLVPGEEAGLAIRQSEQDHVRLAVLTGPGGEVVVRAIHRRAGVEEVLGEVWPDVAVGRPLRLAVRVRDLDYALTVATGEAAETRVATVDGRDLDSVATGGFLGLWLGIYGTSAGAASRPSWRSTASSTAPPDGPGRRLMWPAGVVELADTQDLGSCAERREGSSPFSGTKKTQFHKG